MLESSKVVLNQTQLYREETNVGQPSLSYLVRAGSATAPE